MFFFFKWTRRNSVHTRTDRIKYDEKRTYHFKWFIWSGCFSSSYFYSFSVCIRKTNFDYKTLVAFHFESDAYQWKAKNKGNNRPLETCALAERTITIIMYEQQQYTTLVLHTYVRPLADGGDSKIALICYCFFLLENWNCFMKLRLNVCNKRQACVLCIRCNCEIN